MAQNQFHEALFKICDLLYSDEPKFDVIKKIVNYLPLCFRYSQVCSAEILINKSKWRSPYFEESKWQLEEKLVLTKGRMTIYYSAIPAKEQVVFLPDEIRFFKTIAQLVDYYIIQTSDLLINISEKAYENDSQWRMSMAKMVVQKCPLHKLGIKKIYLIGSVKSGKAGPASDIDFLVHCKNKEENRNLIETYFSGWDHAISYENFKRTGYMCEPIIELHIITDDDIKSKSSYAVMIGTTENNALLLKSETDE